jgi:hypothetical protein
MKVIASNKINQQSTPLTVKREMKCVHSLASRKFQIQDEEAPTSLLLIGKARNVI